MCPHCGRDAPIVYRGPLPYCTACGGLRAPLSSPSVNLAGKPSQVGGAVARVVGWLVLLVGLSVSLGLGLLVYSLATTWVALAFALPLALVALVTGLFLVLSGRTLARSGDRTERSTVDQALLELAAHRGAVTAADAARVLGVGVAEADAMLTALAKRDPERFTVDIDEQGGVWYRPARFPGEAFDARLDPRMRVEDPNASSPKDGTSPAPPGRGQHQDGTSPAPPGRGQHQKEEGSEDREGETGPNERRSELRR